MEFADGELIVLGVIPEPAATAFLMALLAFGLDRMRRGRKERRGEAIQ